MADCPWYSWLWYCRAEGENSSWWSEGLAPGVVSLPKAWLYGLAGIFGLTANLMALSSLHKCNVNFSTLILMQLQCGMNVLGLFAKTVCAPIALVTGQAFPFVSWGRFVFQIPGGMLVMAIYGQFALQAMMAINRLVAICYRTKAKIWFSDERSLQYASLCVLHGFWNMAMCLFACCPCYFDQITHKWGYHKGWGSGVRKPITIISDVVCCTIIFICYARTFRKIRQLGSQMSTSEMSKKELQRERKVFFQFFTVAMTWLGYSVVYRPVYYINAVQESSVAMVLSELVRFWMFSVDPIIYFIFMDTLRAHVVRLMSCGSVVLKGAETAVELSEARARKLTELSRKGSSISVISRAIVVSKPTTIHPMTPIPE